MLGIKFCTSSQCLKYGFEIGRPFTKRRKISTTSLMEMYSNFVLANIIFDRRNPQIVRKMANGRLLFLALHHVRTYVDKVVPPN